MRDLNLISQTSEISEKFHPGPVVVPCQNTKPFFHSALPATNKFIHEDDDIEQGSGFVFITMITVQPVLEQTTPSPQRSSIHYGIGRGDTAKEEGWPPLLALINKRDSWFRLETVTVGSPWFITSLTRTLFSPCTLCPQEQISLLCHYEKYKLISFPHLQPYLIFWSSTGRINVPIFHFPKLLWCIHSLPLQSEGNECAKIAS